MEPYKPIACSLHDILEDRIVRRVKCQVEFGAGQIFTGRMVDIVVRDGAESLVLEDGSLIRLDQLQRVDGTDFN
jgi:transcriptional antiterminator Rof (Rho-off)